MDSVQRFSGRTGNYRRYRPRYPHGLLDWLGGEAGLPAGAAVADVGAGTGLLTHLLLEGGYAVHAVEPNPDMRATAAEELQGFPRLRLVAGTAEETTLPAGSVQMVAAAQAFHWFDPAKAAREFRRILSPGGLCVLLWNERDTAAAPLMRAYEDLLQGHGLDYEKVRYRNMDPGVFREFFGKPYRETEFSNSQTLDQEGFIGRLCSSSYTPPAGHPGHAPMLAAANALFSAHAQGGRVEIIYRTRIYWGTMA